MRLNTYSKFILNFDHLNKTNIYLKKLNLVFLKDNENDFLTEIKHHFYLQPFYFQSCLLTNSFKLNIRNLIFFNCFDTFLISIFLNQTVTRNNFSNSFLFFNENFLKSSNLLFKKIKINIKKNEVSLTHFIVRE